MTQSSAASAARRRLEPGDFTTERSVLPLIAMALVVWSGGTLTAWLLIKLIALVTNAVWFGRVSTVSMSLAHVARSPWMVIAPALERWAGKSEVRRSRARHLFALEDTPWNEERVLDRYELLYEAGLAPEAARDRARAQGGAPAEPGALTPALGEPMISDHRRILATGLGRLRGKLKYRPVVFELMGDAFTLSSLQKAVEAVAGVALHKQNFRRVVAGTGLVEGLGRMDAETGGRPAELFRFRRELLADRPASGLSLPLLRE